MAETQLDKSQGQLNILKSALEGMSFLGVKNMVTSMYGFVDWLNSMEKKTSTQKIISF